MASIPTFGGGTKSAHRTLEASARAMVAMSSGTRGAPGMKRIVSGGRNMGDPHNVSKASIHGPDLGEGGGN